MNVLTFVFFFDISLCIDISTYMYHSFFIFIFFLLFFFSFVVEMVKSDLILNGPPKCVCVGMRLA